MGRHRSIMAGEAASTGAFVVRVGEHPREVVIDHLGLSDADFERLAAAQAFG